MVFHRQKTGTIVLVVAVIAIMAVLILSTRNFASKNPYDQNITVSYSASVENATVFEALMDYSKTIGIEVKYNNNYEFGVLIESIGDKKNGDNGKYWQYYVNNELGDVAADKKNISKSDIIEWRFEKVPF